MLEKQNGVTGYRSSSMASEVAQENLIPGGDQNIDNVSEGVDYGDDWDVDGAVCGESV